ncbi:urea carboxylase [Shouchella clausii]|uniref:urea carboxylase n=1 Tax=Shouchella clausii TaxID=79880 RepID=UPI002DBDD1F9|nr:urea carboxylase [Shouchella clausii]MEB5479864.1 urea carboxylase [Shouchella clausii]
MFKKILIANRGAIAVRIIRTVKKMGIKTVAVYTKADESSLHVHIADEAVFIGEGPAQTSYLNEKTVLQAAKATGAEAIHPGYGFLSENAGFARACQRAGIQFIGPKPEQIEQFGLKHEARALALQAEVPLLPGTELLHQKEEALHEAASIGYPVMLKSTAGGGGIGMRICTNETELADAYEAVIHLAKQHFGNKGLFLEKYVPRARHIEVQLFGSESGNVVVLGERDCSIQRRNQKVIEETPAPNLPERVRENMHNAALRLAETVGYVSAGTVEFLYDETSEQFYFLEVNTRLQVEHGVTEEAYHIDLVEWMVEEAAGEWSSIQAKALKPRGYSIQARVYAEDCQLDFRPSAGTLDAVVLSEHARTETWVEAGTTVSTLYDPMLAKIIATGKTRAEAIGCLLAALRETRFYGVTSNLPFLEVILSEPSFQAGMVYTTFLDTFKAEEPALEVLDGGIQTTVQDYPARLGHWDVGVPPSGPMDAAAFRIGNRLLGNEEGAAGLELTLVGGSYRFRGKTSFCLTGANMEAELDGERVPLYKRVTAPAGSVLKLAKATAGMRTYLLVEGGIDVPKLLGSSATFTLGGFGGHGGRALRQGDVLRLKEAYVHNADVLFEAKQPLYSNTWTIGVVPGPHSTSDYIDPAYMEQLATAEYEVHFNSSRTGVRLSGPAPIWAREDGGDAGLHPSNIHDNAYAIGSLDLTGDTPILLGPDGPSLGGFVCPVTTATAELWKIGQLQPGDKVKFQLLTLEQARQQLRKLERAIETGGHLPALPKRQQRLAGSYPLLYQSDTDGHNSIPIAIRAAGDAYVLVEYGEMELHLPYRFQAHLLMEAIQAEKDFPVFELTPGIRSLQIHLDPHKWTVIEACERIIALNKRIPPLETVKVPSRIVKLPLSWDDPSAQLAMERYEKNIRPDAPWCPDNIEFIRRINGLQEVDEVAKTVFAANYMVLGLGDVYLGAPVATPTDPRHRLVTTKYNPARTWTPENAVGIGGAYMCIYGLEGPGGYQLVGRTVQIWNHVKPSKSFQDGKPWLLRFFDQIQYYPVTEAELAEMRGQMAQGTFEVEMEETTFRLGDYLQFLEDIREGSEAFKQKQQAAFQAEREDWKKKGLAEYVSDVACTGVEKEEMLPEGVEAVASTMPGSVWKVMVETGQFVEKGDVLLIEESMKMEFPQRAPVSGTVEKIFVKPGDEVQSGTRIAAIAAKKSEVSV